MQLASWFWILKKGEENAYKVLGWELRMRVIIREDSFAVLMKLEDDVHEQKNNGCAGG